MICLRAHYRGPIGGFDTNEIIRGHLRDAEAERFQQVLKVWTLCKSQNFGSGFNGVKDELSKFSHKINTVSLFS
jgi:hypothetical protein